MPDVQAPPVTEGVFEERDGRTVLLGSRCPRCEAVYFPRRDSCANPTCGGALVEPTELSGGGTVHSYTVQHYAPPAPFDLVDAPYAIVVVELDAPIRVVGLYTGPSDRVRIGDAVELTTLAVRRGDGTVTTWAFRSAGVDEEAADA